MPPNAPLKQRFKIISKLGSGGMATVYLALDTQRQQEVALKELGTAHLGNKVTVERFRREFESAQALDHPNIVKYHELFEDDKGGLTISMEYVQGRPLAEIIDAPQADFDLSARISIMTQIASALCAAHAAGIIHRDLKPGNIIVTEELCAKLTDFGVARLSSESLELTRTGDTIGTPYYMSPEQIRNEEIDERADIYSFGVLCYELLTGKKPFEQDTLFGVTSAHLLKAPPNIRSVSRDVPAWLERLISVCLQKDRADRYQSMADVLAKLKDAVAGENRKRGLLGTLFGRLLWARC